ncbi:MAG: hypothetical protein JO255_11035, partial [Alphaproteobacteria bacterium]|nr:hypothetical protein [Alphaproteobacteria bacterium]
MPSQELTERLEFLRVDRDTSRALADFLPLLKPELPRIIDAFYGHLRRNAKLAALFKGADGMKRAGEAQTRH